MRLQHRIHDLAAKLGWRVDQLQDEYKRMRTDAQAKETELIKIARSGESDAARAALSQLLFAYSHGDDRADVHSHASDRQRSG